MNELEEVFHKLDIEPANVYGLHGVLYEFFPPFVGKRSALVAVLLSKRMPETHTSEASSHCDRVDHCPGEVGRYMLEEWLLSENAPENQRIPGMALAAILGEGNAARMLGVSRYYLNPETGMAEFALVVSDAYQRQRLGRHLMQRLIAIARERGVKRLVGQVLAENRPMLDLLRSLGFSPSTPVEAQVIPMELVLAEAGFQANGRTFL